MGLQRCNELDTLPPPSLSHAHVHPPSISSHPGPLRRHPAHPAPRPLGPHLRRHLRGPAEPLGGAAAQEEAQGALLDPPQGGNQGVWVWVCVFAFVFPWFCCNQGNGFHAHACALLPLATGATRTQLSLSLTTHTDTHSLSPHTHAGRLCLPGLLVQDRGPHANRKGHPGPSPLGPPGKPVCPSHHGRVGLPQDHHQRGLAPAGGERGGGEDEEGRMRRREHGSGG
jgi:hypothetical protein